MADIFISYAHPDRAKIEPLVAAIEGPAAAASVVSQAAPGANKTYLIAGVAVVAMIALVAFFMIGLPKKDTPAEIATASNEIASEPALPAQSEQASIAVLPFVSMTANEEDRFFADGLTEEILNALTVLPNILVTSRTSAFQFRGEDLPPAPEIAKTLGVDYILEGSVRRAGDIGFPMKDW